MNVTFLVEMFDHLEVFFCCKFSGVKCQVELSNVVFLSICQLRGGTNISQIKDIFVPN